MLGIIKNHTKELVGDTINNVKFAAISWNSNEGFYYSSYEAPEGSKLSSKTDQHILYYHKLGTEQKSDKVIFGTTVIVVDDNNKKVTYKIVGEDEADIKIGKLSVTSPISRSLVGKNEGEIVVIKTPSGEKEYEIIEVKYV